MGKTFRIVLFLIALFGVLFLLAKYTDILENTFSQKSARVKYERQLRRNFGKSVRDEFKTSAQNALNDFVKPTLPFVERGFFRSDRMEAFGYRISLLEGEKLNVDMSSDSSIVFCEIFLMKGENVEDWPIYNVAHFEPGTVLNTHFFISEKSNDYFVRIQPELGRNSFFKLELYLSPSLGFPVQGKDKSAIQSFWGAARDGGKRKHEGVDIFAPKGTEVLAVEPGQVTSTRKGGLGGKTVRIRALNGRHSTYYAHLNKQLVKKGEYVDTGDVIGTVGNTGNARTTPAHLHFGVYKSSNRRATDPFPYIAQKALPSSSDQPLLSTDKGEVMTHLSQTNLRTGPNVKHKLILGIGPNTELDILGEINSWFHVRTPSGTAGFIAASVLNY